MILVLSLVTRTVKFGSDYTEAAAIGKSKHQKTKDVSYLFHDKVQNVIANVSWSKC